MKSKHKDGFKRHIKMDDSSMCLYIDAFIPRVKEWVRIDVEIAREDNAKRQKKRTDIVNKDLRTVESDDEEEQRE